MDGSTEDRGRECNLMTEERMNLIKGIILAVKMCKCVKGEMTEDHLVYFGQDDEVTREEAAEVLAMKEAA